MHFIRKLVSEHYVFTNVPMLYVTVEKSFHQWPRKVWCLTFNDLVKLKEPQGHFIVIHQQQCCVNRSTDCSMPALSCWHYFCSIAHDNGPSGAWLWSWGVFPRVDTTLAADRGCWRVALIKTLRGMSRRRVTQTVWNRWLRKACVGFAAICLCFLSVSADNVALLSALEYDGNVR